MLKNFKMFTVLSICLFFVCACSKGPEKTVSSFFDEVKKGNFNKSAEYTDAPIFQDTESEEEVVLLKEYFKRFEYSNIKLVSKEDNTAVVEVEISGVDLSAVVENFLMKLYEEFQEKGLTEPPYSDQELDAMLLESIRSPEAPIKKMILNLFLVKTASGTSTKWLIAVDEDLRMGIFMQESADYEEDYSYDDYMDEQALNFEVVETKELKMVYLDVIVQNVCAFEVEGEPYYMECSDEHMSQLEPLKGSEVTVVFDVLSNIAAVSSADQASTFYILKEVKK